MTLITRKGEVPDLYTPVEAAADLSLATGPIVVPLTVIDAALADGRNERVGLSVDNATPVSAIAPYLPSLDLVQVTFPSFSDGRGLSLAKRLRRAGYTGRLRAFGPLIADQFAEALACGFDEVKLPPAMAERQPVEQWLAAKDIVEDHYQSGYGEDQSILQKRLASAREAGA